MNPQAETKTVVGDRKTTKGKLLQSALYLNKEEKSKTTIATYLSMLRKLSKHADLENPETVKLYLSKTKTAPNTKATYRVAYTAFLSWQGKKWSAKIHRTFTDT